MHPLFASLPLLAAFALAGCSGGGGGGEDFAGHVEVYDDEFEPGEATVAPGTTVHFMLDDGAAHPHTVTIHKQGDAPSAYLKNTNLAAGGTTETSFNFDEAGTYHVWCRNHGDKTSGMHMLVTVE